ncbi:MAG: sodium:proton antiporter [Candidatus Poribacteria bacterium]|nr:MAG: sodium:proton antiporter [Candidatus Poribacteria bacterium]
MSRVVHHRRSWVWLLVLVLICLPTLGALAAEGAAEHGAAHPSIGEELPLYWVIPFVGILLSIALGPILAPHWWHHNYPKASAFWAAAFAIPFLIVFGLKGELSVAFHEILHIYLVDYIPFIILLGGLFTAAGGIVLRGTVVGTPMVNVLFILVGSILASWIGTTGASMVLIRPLLRANRHRQHRMHIVIIFIFLVSNIGGSLTPLGDPPLFLGFLHGVPFHWTISLLPEAALMVAAVLVIFYFLERHYLKREPWAEEEQEEEAEAARQPVRLVGYHNFLFLLGIMGAVLLSGVWHPGEVNILGVHVPTESLVRDVIILIMAFAAYKTTHPDLRKENGFTWEPIREVAYLFAGIFMTIVPALAILRAGENGAAAFVIRAARSEPAYFWLTGTLSSFLDNAPTYLTFFNTALGQLHLSEPAIAEYLRNVPLPFFHAHAPSVELTRQILQNHADTLPYFAAMSEAQAIPLLQEKLAHFETYLKAISIGAVFMGANTYIGNAPNFMVRSIAIENGVKMPSFFGYMLWSLCILVPLFLVITFVFF